MPRQMPLLLCRTPAQSLELRHRSKPTFSICICRRCPTGTAVHWRFRRNLHHKDAKHTKLSARSSTFTVLSPMDLRGFVALWLSFRSVGRHVDAIDPPRPRQTVQAIALCHAGGHRPEAEGTFATGLMGTIEPILASPDSRAGSIAAHDLFRTRGHFEASPRRQQFSFCRRTAFLGGKDLNHGCRSWQGPP